MVPTGLLLAMTGSRWHRAVETVLQEHHVSLAHVLVLEAVDHLCRRGTPPHQADVSRFTGIDVMTISINVRALAGRDLIIRSVKPSSTRRVFVELAPPGVVLLARLHDGLHAADAAVFPNDERRMALHNMLLTCVEDSTT